MEEEKLICIRDLVGSGHCISPDGSQIVFDSIRSALSRGNKVRISFENIESLSASFLDAAIGRLCNEEIEGNIDEMLLFENISPGRKLIVEETIREAKEYYKDPDKYLAKRAESTTTA